MSQETDLHNISLQLERIAVALEALARPDQNYTPDYVRPIEEYNGFDWASINATVVNADQDGPTHIQWNGRVYTRRSPSNKFDPAIWYSRAVGKDDNGDNEYARLITFRKITGADALPEKARDALKALSGNGNGHAHPPAPSNPPEPSGLLSFREYITLAKQKGVSEEAAKWIAGAAEVRQENDHSEVARYLDFFSAAKQAGMTPGAAWRLLEGNGKDPKKAVTKLPNFK